MSDKKSRPDARETTDPRLKNLRPWRKGQSGNPAGSAKIEPKVRRFARTYDKRMCIVLAAIAEDTEVAPSERRKAAMDLIAVGSGRPALLQEIAGRNGSPLGPLLNVNIGAAHGGQLAPETAYRLMVESVIPLDPGHEAFRPARPAIEADPASAPPPGEETQA